jgi:hypothetical protein
MPLVHSASQKALDTNMATLHADIGKSKHVQSRKQAIAIALNTQREAKKKPKRALRNGQVSDRARERMRNGADEDIDRVDAATA